MNYYSLILILATLTSISSCKKESKECTPQTIDTTDRMVFQSGYESGSVGNSNDDITDITGIDASKDSLNDWVNDLEGESNFGNFKLYYEDGTMSDRYAKIIDEPGNTTNKILAFWLKNASIKNGINHKKGRIQGSLSENVNLKEFYIKQRLYIHPDLEVLKDYPKKITWLTLQEFWNNATYTDEGYIFRITLNIQKTTTETGELYFGAHGQTQKKKKKWESVWEETASSFPIPFGEWVTIETYVKEGDNTNGRFKFVVTTNDNVVHTLIDVTNYTYHPNDPCPNGFSEFNPMKMYTDDNLIDYTNEKNKVLQVYWDDLELWKNHQP